jgi:hypothetical protein
MAHSDSPGAHKRGVLVEVKGLDDPSPLGATRFMKHLSVTGCTVDPEHEPVPMGEGATHLIRCLVKSEDVVEKLRQRPEVAAVWNDTEIAPME